MPDPKNYKDEESFMEACVPAVKGEGKDQDQAVAQCISMWKERDNKPEEKALNLEEERRFFNVEELRIQRDESKTPKIVGYAAVFNSLSENLGSFREQIAPGAFRKALKTSDVRALFNHNPDFVLGRTTSGTLKLTEDKRGLWMELTPPDSQIIRDLVITPIERGDITQQSFGFTVKSDKWDDIEGEVPTRTLLEINELFDVSPVTYPAYKDTNVSIALRSLEEAKKDKEKPKFTHVETKDIEPELTRSKISELKEIADKLNGFLAGLENTSEAEPMQGKEEIKKVEDKTETTKEGAGDPMKAEEVRDVMTEIDKKFEKYGERFFK